jgi:hypothetical protein
MLNEFFLKIFLAQSFNFSSFITFKFAIYPPVLDKFGVIPVSPSSK